MNRTDATKPMSGGPRGIPQPAPADPEMEPASEDAGDTTGDTDWWADERPADVQPHDAKKPVGERTGMGPALF
ncbi:hypothetical protein CcaverHIS002_0404660 [Cutaneotrichosporon cavernicola]|uniref:Uncharacterized protein n=1 Tax=Cutaneotrichosporon cavernicola TaxID=279322 RepID=A0AA48L478_9TREE|nr:uncharacterized protein CcaverHIS019_0404620 [Cutaneotrichosporon cavernicola]BEI83862.1 hypothetical protein CcaverHIS002_0404660 [Cutaneotrichosporon cavernicola]BEI91642.1 hypothetical protein CcaverHIS019_0404620 [Cutaneotrichosporon cavernicola]